MQINRWTSLVLLCALTLSQGSALAQPGRDKDAQCRPGDRGCERGNGQYNARRYQSDERYQDSRREDRERRGFGGERADRGAGPEHDFYRGGRLPLQYRSKQYVVNDWHGHGLRSPPRGYQWVQTGGDYVLVAIATGIILELLLNR
jgi:Ni/Co efflux regulator RcnB